MAQTVSAIPEGMHTLTPHLTVNGASDYIATFAQATAAGCKVTMPLSDQFWGDRYGQLEDPTGFRWAIGTRKEIVTPEEMQRRQKAMFGGA